VLKRLVPIQNKIHCNLRLDDHRFLIQQIRTILPLLYGDDCGLDQQRRTADSLNMLHSTIFTNSRPQDDRALNPELFGNDRIFGKNLVEESTQLHSETRDGFVGWGGTVIIAGPLLTIFVIGIEPAQSAPQGRLRYVGAPVAG